MPAGQATKRVQTRFDDRRAKKSETDELHDRIASRAYQLFEERGSVAGHALEDWLQAEQEVLSEQLDTDFG
jgi:hypothetical protein